MSNIHNEFLIENNFISRPLEYQSFHVWILHYFFGKPLIIRSVIFRPLKYHFYPPLVIRSDNQGWVGIPVVMSRKSYALDFEAWTSRAASSIRRSSMFALLTSQQTFSRISRKLIRAAS
jgi:hypothetical protein